MQLQLKIDNGQLTIKVKMLRILLKSKRILKKFYHHLHLLWILQLP